MPAEISNDSLFEFIEAFHNQVRMHSVDDCLSLEKFVRKGIGTSV